MTYIDYALANQEQVEEESEQESSYCDPFAFPVISPSAVIKRPSHTFVCNDSVYSIGDLFDECEEEEVYEEEPWVLEEDPICLADLNELYNIPEVEIPVELFASLINFNYVKDFSMSVIDYEFEFNIWNLTSHIPYVEEIESVSDLEEEVEEEVVEAPIVDAMDVMSHYSAGCDTNNYNREENFPVKEEVTVEPVVAEEIDDEQIEVEDDDSMNLVPSFVHSEGHVFALNETCVKTRQEDTSDYFVPSVQEVEETFQPFNYHYEEKDKVEEQIIKEEDEEEQDNLNLSGDSWSELEAE